MRIDVHAHYFPEPYLQALDRGGNADALPAARRAPWASMPLDERADLLASHGIDLQVISVASPGPYLAKAADAATAARLGNDIYADVTRGYGGRYAAFATVPLPHVDEAVAEVGRCLDTLGMLGVTLGCSVAGRQLDDPAFEPFFAELDRRATVLFLHPVGVSGGPESLQYGLNWMVGAPFEDTLAALRLVLSGLTTRYPKIKVIVPHLGGTLPFLLQRLDDQAERQRKMGEPINFQEDPSTLVRRFWFDTVNSHPAALRCSCESFGVGRIMLGTDFPYLVGPAFTRCVEYVKDAALPPADTQAIYGDNAAALLGITQP
jgi:predicted TIM-barrel fold metal-dependent hydrolase